MNAPSVRRWSHRHMAKVMGLLFIVLGILVIVVCETNLIHHEKCGMSLASFFLVTGSLLCVA